MYWIIVISTVKIDDKFHSFTHQKIHLENIKKILSWTIWSLINDARTYPPHFNLDICLRYDNLFIMTSFIDNSSYNI